MNYKKSVRSLVGLLAAGILMSACNNATESNKTESPAKAAEEQNDQKFSKADEKDAQLIVDAWLGSSFEMRMADSAKKYVSTDEGKRLAGMLADAHANINSRIQQLAADKQITLPTDITDDQKKKIEAIKNNKAKDFDKDFAKAMVDKHEDAIKMYEKSANDATDADIKAYFTSTLPELRTHLDMATKSKDILDK
jgi:putative membrane protein